MNEDQISAADAENMKQLLTDFSEQWSEAMEFTKNLDLRINKGRVENVCLAGMGSSAIGAHLIQAYSRNSITVPAEVVRHYRIPGWLNEQTLFIACSFSGNTEETLAALQEAWKRGAQALAITSGGKLLLEATRNDFDYIKIPGGIPPRA
ncbi:MAG: SIS domain-containing protein, partial [Balneolaceae bacterium]